MSAPKRPARRCNGTIEVRIGQRRAVYDRWQCKNKTRHESGYCHIHRINPVSTRQAR